MSRGCQVLFIEARDVKVVKRQWSAQHLGSANLPQKHQSRRKGLERVRFVDCHCSFTAFAVRKLRTVQPCQESPSETYEPDYGRAGEIPEAPDFIFERGDTDRPVYSART
jgi:hypothetical protein